MDLSLKETVFWSFRYLPTQKLCIHFVYKNCTRFIQLMYTKCIQNVYLISTSFCLHFVYKIKRTMPTKLCIQNVYKSLSKHEIHFVYKHFVAIHFVYINSDLQKVYIIPIMYTICIQNLYRMYIQIIVC